MGEPKLDVRAPTITDAPPTPGRNGSAGHVEAESSAGRVIAPENAPTVVEDSVASDATASGRPGHRTNASDSGVPPRRWTVEMGLYGLLISLAAVTRFWDLGSRTLHHDESLHAWYSYLYATGQGYVHDPLMHGPFLFHANALVYLLLGASDATSRLMPALFGTVLVGLPWFLRGPRLLGRWGALAASVLLLVSPSLLYQGRYIRHDIYTVVGALVLFIAIVRYVDRPERRWLVTAGAALGFLLTNHEIVFGIAGIFVGVLWGTLLWGRLRFLVPLHVAAVAVLGVVWLLKPGPLGQTFPAIPWDRSGSEAPLPTRDNQLAYYADLLTHPLIVSLAAVLALAVGVGVLLLVDRSSTAGRGRAGSGLALIGVGAAALWAAAVALVDESGSTAIGGWGPLAGANGLRFIVGGTLVAAGTVAISSGFAAFRAAVGRDGVVAPVLGGSPPGSVGAAALRAVRDPAGLAAAFVAGALIFVVLFTSLFSNVEGLFTGTIATDGTLFYWLGQHDVQRGEQPWFYFLVLIPQYEILALVFGVVGVVAVVAAAVRAVAGRSAVGPRFFFRFFLAVWFVGIFAALSWAGEKMPWLIVHIALPAILLSGSVLGDLVERWQTRPARMSRETSYVAGDGTTTSTKGGGAAWGWGETGLLAGLLVLGAGWLILAGRLSYGAFVEGATAGGWERAVTANAADRWWWLALAPAAALVLIGTAWLVRGPRRTGRAVLTTVVAGLVLLQIHAGWRTAYLEGDVPKDMLIYTQTSPDVSRMVRELGALSAELTGGKGMEIWYDSGVSWPLQWYLRDFPNRQLRNGPFSGPPDDVPVVIVTNTGLGSTEPFLDDYTAQEYVLRWWFPEDHYRNFAIAPEIPPGRSAWDGAEDQRSPLAIARSVLDSASSLLTPEGQQDVYRLVMYRDLWLPIGWDQGTYRYTVFVRNDLVPTLNDIRY